MSNTTNNNKSSVVEGSRRKCILCLCYLAVILLMALQLVITIIGFTATTLLPNGNENNRRYHHDFFTSSSSPQLRQPYNLSRAPTKKKELHLQADWKTKPMMVTLLLVDPYENKNVHPASRNKDALYPKYHAILKDVIRNDYDGLPSQSKRHHPVPEELGNGIAIQNDIEKNSRRYKKGKPDIISKDENCIPQYDYQKQSFSLPTCNVFHELDLVETLTMSDKPSKIVASGGWRDVWDIAYKDPTTTTTTTTTTTDNNKHHPLESSIALKTLRFVKDRNWNERSIDKHRRDAVVMERLHASPNIVNMYGYCGASALTEFAQGGDLFQALHRNFESWDSKTKLQVAYQITKAIADLHNMDEEGKPSIAHMDLRLEQFVNVNVPMNTTTNNNNTTTNKEETSVVVPSYWKLNDFNSAQFIYHKNSNHSERCPFVTGVNDGVYRSPEEYKWSPTKSEKSDIYTLGNLYYVMLTKQNPFEEDIRNGGGLNDNKIKRKVIQGQRPNIPDVYTNSSDLYVQSLVRILQKCWNPEPSLRPSAREIENELFSIVSKEGARLTYS